MLEKLTYKNHLNEVFDFGKEGIFVNSNDLHNFAWNATTKNNRITLFRYGVATRKIPVVIICNSEEEGIAARNRLFEVTDKDVLALQHGRIIIGDYYFRCFVTKSEKANYLQSKRYMTVDLTLTSDFPYWVKETKFSFSNSGSGRSAEGLDFPKDYQYDFTNSIGSTSMNNSGFVDSNFRMVIYGACSNPTVYINDHAYTVNCTVEENEYLTIDSTAKTITLTSNDGTVTNKFRDRGRNTYIFQKIPAGSNTVSWEGNYGIDITLLEERSEPKWT